MTELSCRCGGVGLTVEGPPIASVDCCCTSCRAAGERMRRLPGAPATVDAHGGTPFVLYRKDRVRFERGADQLAGFRLKPDAPTRRVVATCCNTPVFLEFQSGHWLSLYANLWPAGARPKVEMRTMTGDMDSRLNLPDDIPNPKTHRASFFARLLWAWLAMGFRVPKIAVAREIEI